MSMWWTSTSLHHSLSLLQLCKASNILCWLLRRKNFGLLPREPFSHMKEWSSSKNLYSTTSWIACKIYKEARQWSNKIECKNALQYDDALHSIVQWWAILEERVWGRWKWQSLSSNNSWGASANDQDSGWL